MKKYLLLALIVLMAAACTNQYERNLQRMGDGVKKYFEDEAFKNDGKVEFLEFKTVSYDTINENLLDSFRLNFIRAKIDSHDSDYEELMKKVKKKYYEASLYKSAGLQDIAKHELEGVQEYLDRAEEQMMEINRLLAMDSAICVSIQNRKNPAIFYRIKYFAKMTLLDKETGSKNLMDTLYLVFDQKFNVVKLPE